MTQTHRHTRALSWVLCTLLTFSAACGSDADGANNSSQDNNTSAHQVDESTAQLSENGTFYVMYSADPAPIPFNELFDLVVMVHDGEDHSQMLMDAEIEVEATMPAHEHGMNTEPTVTKEDDGSFLVEGMKFHMRSDTAEDKWQVHVDVTHEETTERATFNVMCCEE
ncbi:MAG: hypothetical protein ACOC9W_01025 [Persicimonas sp.]